MTKSSSTSVSPPELTFFTDRDLGRIVPAALAASGLRVESHDDHFGPTTSDQEWLREAGRRGWIALTRNSRIRYTPLEIEALMRARVRCFILIGRKATHQQLANFFVNAIDVVQRFVVEYPEPFIAKVRRGRQVDLWLSEREWLRRGGGR